MRNVKPPDPAMYANFHRAELEFRLKKVGETREAWERAGCPEDWRWSDFKRALEAFAEKRAEVVK